MKLSVSSKLLLIMTSTLSLVLVVALIGWLGFAQVADKQSSVVDEAVPAMELAHRLNSVNSHLLSLVPQLMQPKHVDVFDAVVTGIEKQLTNIEEMTTDYQGLISVGTRVWVLPELADDIRTNFEHQRRLAQGYLVRTERFDMVLQETRSALVNIYQISASLVANANTTTAAMASSLYDLPTSDTQTLYSAFDRLIDVDLDHLERMYELRKVATEIRNVLDGLPEASSAKEVAQLRKRALPLLQTLSRRMDDINDPGRRGQAQQFVNVVSTHLDRSSEDSLFAQRLESLDAYNQQLRLEQDMKSLLVTLNTQVLNLSDQMSQRMHQASTDAREAVVFGRNLLLSVGLALAAAGVFFLWFYLRKKLFARIDQVNNALLAVAQGNLTASVDYHGKDELGRLAKTIGVFQDNATVRNELEQQRELVANRLRRYQAELEEQIQARTHDLQRVNSQLQETSKNHEKARSEAEQANRAKTDFLATMSHEIRTPLSGILGTLRLLESTSLDTSQQSYVQLSLCSAEALLMILNGILDFAKIESGELIVETVATDVAQISKTVQSIISPSTQEKGIALNLHIAPQLIAKRILIDQSKLHQILFNLLSNAVKFTAQGSISVSLAECPDRAEPWLRCRVTDTGLGIPEVKREYLFQPFTQYDASTARRFGGTGLGLSICQQLTQAMGGRIGISSRVEYDYTQGTCVWFELPFEYAEDELTECNVTTSEMDTHAALAILVVEDNEIGRTVAEAMLTKLGHQVTAVNSGLEALDLAHVDFDVIFMDVSMPGMDGVETSLRLRKSHQSCNVSIPIVAMSAHIFPQEVEEFLRAGMDGFIGKPLDTERLQTVIAQVVADQETPVSMPARTSKEVLNVSVLDADLEMLGGARMINLITLFDQRAQEQLEAMQTAHHAQQWLAIADMAHSMKSAAGSMGLGQLFQLSSQLENQARHRQSASVDLIMADIPSVVTDSLRALQVWRSRQDI